MASGPATSCCVIVYEVSGRALLFGTSTLQVSASILPVDLRLLAAWNAASALRKLSPSLPSISPGEKLARSSKTSALTINAGALTSPCRAAELTESGVRSCASADEGRPWCAPWVAALTAVAQHRAMRATMNVRRANFDLLPVNASLPQRDRGALGQVDPVRAARFLCA